VILGGRSAIVTGASRGLGRAIARAFVEAGASVLMTGRDEAALERAVTALQPLARSGQGVAGLTGSVADERTVSASLERVRALPGQFTILVNNAGVYGPMGPIETVDLDEWLEALEINLVGTVRMCRAAIPLFRGQRYGKILNLSGGGATAPLPRFTAYAASKAAVVRLTETLAHELADARVDVNAMAPGALNTRLLDQVLEAGPDRVGAEFYQRAVKQREDGGAPLERGSALAAFLASPASDGITGRLLSAVWDKWEDLGRHREELAGSDVYTLRRIVPADRGQPW
jgi:NAD(P)-dependent dehydrogenase (short-subunit alcohol dehydrogenase family)